MSHSLIKKLKKIPNGILVNGSHQNVLYKLKENDEVVDVGTGSGVLSIAAALLGASHVTALDLDEVAVESAKQNVELNKVDKLVDVSQNNLLDGVKGKKDVVVANILAEIIMSFTDDVASAVKPGGYFISSGIISQKKEDVKQALLESGFEIEETIMMEDWVAFIAKKA